MAREALPGVWLRLFRAIVEATSEPRESVDDVLAGAWWLGQLRASVLQRDFDPRHDVAFALALWCWYPFKVESDARAQEAIRRARRTVFASASTMDDHEMEKRFLEVVPRETLRLPFGELLLIWERGDVLEHLRIP